MKPIVYTVSNINRYMKQMMEDDVLLNGFFVEAELSNFKEHSSGHFYFSLKDKESTLACVMFRGNAQFLRFVPENGMKVVVYGKVSVYEKTGQCQLYAELMEPFGKGSLFVAFEQLKNKLEKEGLFDSSYKKPIPPFPKTIAIVTSKTGAAVHDIITVSKRRNKNVLLVVVPVLVQGNEAAKEMARAISQINHWGKADVIILARGGGSMEDLWAFNEEELARAIFASNIPIVSGVGHETDFTIADFVSDLRAPTPSAAAEMVVFDLQSKWSILQKQHAAINQALDHKLEYVRLRLNQSAKLLDKSIFAKTQALKLKLTNLTDGLEKVSPLNLLKRGYCLVTTNNQQVVSHLSQVDIGSELDITLQDGQLGVVVSRKKVGHGEEKANRTNH